MIDMTLDNISLQEHDENVANLLNNLDSNAKNNCQKIIDRLDNLYYSQTLLLNDIYTNDELSTIKELQRFRKRARLVNTHWELDSYKLPINFFEPSVFYYRNGVIGLKDKSKINGKTILDVGCYICDSVLVFREEFPNSPIISFEPSPLNYSLAMQTVKLNNLQGVRVENIGLGDKNTIMSMRTLSGGGLQ